MNKIFEDLNLPGSNTRPVIIKRQSSSNKRIEIQLEFEIVEKENMNSGRNKE